MTARLLTKLLPHGTNLNGSGIRAKSDISATDVAAALAYGSLPKYASYMGLAKYCADDHAKYSLLQHFERKIQRKINKQKWHDSQGRAKGLALLTVAECIHETECKSCNGHGVFIKRTANNGKTCRACNGSGKSQLSCTQQSKIASISTSSWTRTWKHRHESFLQYAYCLEDKAIKHLKKQLLS